MNVLERRLEALEALIACHEERARKSDISDIW